MSLRKFFGPVATRGFWKVLYKEISEDNVTTGAASLAYYLLLALFPLMIFMLSLLPYLPIEDLHAKVMGLFASAMPGDAAKAVEGTIAEVTQDKKGGLLSFGAVMTLWAASAGMYAIMQQLNITYDVTESRPFWKARGISILMTLMFIVLIVGAFAMIVFGDAIQVYVENALGIGGSLDIAFSVLRYALALVFMSLGFALLYYFGPDVKQDFKFVTPGSVIGVLVLVSASLGFNFYVERFGNYAATYGSLGAVIVLMLWLYITGLVILLGSEINALMEHYSPEGKVKGEKAPGRPQPRITRPPEPHPV
ncbi:MAG: YihY/virulence factor BrkB family protein [Bdellovibrionota bacterium]